MLMIPLVSVWQDQVGTHTIFISIKDFQQIFDFQNRESFSLMQFFFFL